MVVPKPNVVVDGMRGVGICIGKGRLKAIESRLVGLPRSGWDSRSYYLDPSPDSRAPEIGLKTYWWWTVGPHPPVELATRFLAQRLYPALDGSGRSGRS